MPTLGVIQRLKTVDYSQDFTFFVTFCVYQRVAVFGDHQLARIAQRILMGYREAGWYRLWCYCIMTDHIHLMMRLLGKQRTLSRVVATLKNKIAYLARLRGSKVTWQLGFHDRVKRSFESIDEYAKYILDNPVRAGLVREPSDYPYSGIVDPWY